MRGFAASSRRLLPPSIRAHEPGEDPAVRARVWSGPVALAVALVLGLRAVYGLAAALFATGTLHSEDLIPSAQLSASVLISPWQRFDALWYQSIAVHGYGTRAGDAAFLPLYAWLEGAIGRLVGGAALGGLIVSTIALAAALVLLWRLTERLAGRRAAPWAVVLMVVAPTSVFLFAGYAEGLFLVEVLAVFLLADRGRLGWAGLLAGIAVLTRDQGLFLAPALLAGVACSSRRPRGVTAWIVALVRSCAPSAVALAGIIGIWEWMGEGFGPWRSEAFWTAQVSLPWVTVADSVRVALRGGHAEELLNLGSIALMLATLPWVWRRLGVSLAVYQALSLLVILCRQTDITPLTSADRFILVLPGVFIAVAAFLERRIPPLRWGVVALSFLASVWVLGRFVTFHFVG